ncbi:Uncharacterized protein FWK35_00027098 [Aphis craccivora]|uniref:DUF7869 domain-containing protein n=1 Tax=Aphis craccivora TaxID=307492 RepID=A0A6G0Y2N2_APHCR|nr:Uncharacterized protein FWK35_00027098 [Aphis craccivora]
MNIRSSRCRKIVSLSMNTNAEFMNRPSTSYYNDEKTIISASDVSSDEYNDSSDEWLPFNSKKGNEIETDSDNSFNNSYTKLTQFGDLFQEENIIIDETEIKLVIKEILDKIENDNAIIFEENTLPESDLPLCRWRRGDKMKWKKTISAKEKKLSKTPKIVDCTNCKFKCSLNFDEDYRIKLCSYFWTLEYNRQKNYILSCVTQKPVKRHVSEQVRKAKDFSKMYTFSLNSSMKVRVCKQFFLKTLEISHGPVDKAFEGVGSENGMFIKNDDRGKTPATNKTPSDVIYEIKSHIEKFPTIESHYCRATTKRKYLDPTLSIAKMYELYLQDCKSRELDNFYKPKKDQCLQCETYKKLCKPQEEQIINNYENHIRRRDESFSAKQLDKEKASNNNNFCSAASPNRAFCFLWTELNGQKGSSEIGTAVYKWIQQLSENITEISLYSDTCSGQNRNQFVAALFLYIVTHSRIEIITHNFMESGHSYMEVDSMHSTIESAKKNVPVYTMRDWLTICRLAHSNRHNKKCSNYTVQELKYTDFLDLKSLANIIMKNRSLDIQGNKTQAIPEEFHEWYKSLPSCSKKKETVIVTESENDSN